MSPTPILDLEQEPPKARRSVAALAIAVLISAIFLAPILAGLITSRAPSFNGLLWLPAIYIGIAIHELGHLFAGKLAGMEPGGLNVGGFQLLKSGRRWVFRFDLSLGVVYGFAKPLPQKGDFRRDHFAWMVGGGPIASTVFAACHAALRSAEAAGFRSQFEETSVSPPPKGNAPVPWLAIAAIALVAIAILAAVALR